MPRVDVHERLDRGEFLRAAHARRTGAGVRALGPSTSDTIHALGVPVTIEASESSSAGLRDALVAKLGR